jgi:formylglycine-generating enzyme required for sulfatase activity
VTITVNDTGGDTLTVDCGGGVMMTLVKIPAGPFMMGTNSTDYDWLSVSRPVHQVTISQAFYMGKYEVTQEQYEAVMGKNPSQFQGAKNPVEQVLWNDAVAFCRALSAKSGRSIRLPSEAEWEYACKADKGNVDTKYYFGDDETQLANHAWYGANSGSTTHLCGQKLPNSFGLFDMSGNVWEWCNDWYGSYSSSPVTDPTGPSSGDFRVLRGGSWRRDVYYCRSSYRFGNSPSGPDDYGGFRVVVGNVK